MMDSMYSLAGAGIGLLPTLLKMLKGDSNNFQGTGLSPGDVAAVSANPTQAIQAYNAAGGDPGTGAMQPLPTGTDASKTASKGFADALSGLAGAFGGGSSGVSAVPPGATQLPTPQMTPPNYAGTGTRPVGNEQLGTGGLSAINPLVMPAGPAATNPMLLAFLKARLGGIA